MVWQDALARGFGFPLPLAARVALFAAVWAIYIADRLLDSRGAVPSHQTARHRFYRRNRAPALALLTLAGLTGVAAAAAFLQAATLIGGILTGSLAAGYLAKFPARFRASRTKHLCAAAIFALGVAAWHPVRATVAPVVELALLCLGNMLLVEHWEHDRNGEPCLFGRSVLAVAFALPMATFAFAPGWQASLATAALMLTAVEFTGESFSPDARSVLADAVLLTPLLFR